MEHDCRVEPIQKVASIHEQEQIELALLAVRGMGCPNCANRVRNGVLALYGVTDASVDHAAGLAQVSYNPALVKIDSLISAIRGAGRDGYHSYEAKLMATALSVSVKGTNSSRHDFGARRLVMTTINPEQSGCQCH
jgi:copper chaperone CopZ